MVVPRIAAPSRKFAPSVKAATVSHDISQAEIGKRVTPVETQRQDRNRNRC